MTAEIKRYEFRGAKADVEVEDDGQYVKYADHLAALPSIPTAVTIAPRGMSFDESGKLQQGEAGTRVPPPPFRKTKLSVVPTYAQLLESLEDVTERLAIINSDDDGHIMESTDRAKALIHAAKTLPRGLNPTPLPGISK
jgi:hypothetical protein